MKKDAARSTSRSKAAGASRGTASSTLRKKISGTPRSAAPGAARLRDKAASGKKFLIAEVPSLQNGDAAGLRALFRRYRGKVCAVGVSDNRGAVGVSALAAASLALQEGVEPVMHLVTRDRNRIALVSDVLGARSLGIENLLVTSGEHQTLGAFGKAKRVYDVDSIQFLDSLTRLSSDAGLVGEKALDPGPLFLGAVADPEAEPAELQMMRLQKKIAAGARFIVTAPVFDPTRCREWLTKANGKLDGKSVALVVGIRILKSAAEAEALVKQRPRLTLPEETLARLKGRKGANAQRAEGIKIALETITALKDDKRIAAFELSSGGDHDAVLEVAEKCGLGEAVHA
jgi:methylenetetrahydrofolate reductase (NADPH)